MSIIDDFLEMADALSVLTTAAVYTTDIIDFGHATPQLQAGTPCFLHCRVATGAVSGGAGTCKLELCHSADNSTWTTFYDSGAVAKGTLVTGYAVYENSLPSGIGRYIKGVFTVATAAFTALAFDMWVSLDATN